MQALVQLIPQYTRHIFLSLELSINIDYFTFFPDYNTFCLLEGHGEGITLCISVSWLYAWQIPVILCFTMARLHGNLNVLPHTLNKKD